jgi:hypothetical protein
VNEQAITRIVNNLQHKQLLFTNTSGTHDTDSLYFSQLEYYLPPQTKVVSPRLPRWLSMDQHHHNSVTTNTKMAPRRRQLGQTRLSERLESWRRDPESDPELTMLARNAARLAEKSRTFDVFSPNITERHARYLKEEEDIVESSEQADPLHVTIEGLELRLPTKAPLVETEWWKEVHEGESGDVADVLQAQRRFIANLADQNLRTALRE